MRKTTIYFPDDLKRRIEKISRTTGKPEASLIRVAAKDAVTPRVPLIDRRLGDATIAENVDALLDEKFGR